MQLCQAPSVGLRRLSVAASGDGSQTMPQFGVSADLGFFVFQEGRVMEEVVGRTATIAFRVNRAEREAV